MIKIQQNESVIELGNLSISKETNFSMDVNKNLNENENDISLSQNNSYFGTRSGNITPEEVDSDSEEIVEINVGDFFIKSLEKNLSNMECELPEGINPVIQVRKSLLQELHALWIESLQEQLWDKDKQYEAIQKGKINLKSFFLL